MDFASRGKLQTHVELYYYRSRFESTGRYGINFASCGKLQIPVESYNYRFVSLKAPSDAG